MSRAYLFFWSTGCTRWYNGDVSNSTTNFYGDAWYGHHWSRTGVEACRSQGRLTFNHTAKVKPWASILTAVWNKLINIKTFTQYHFNVDPPLGHWDPPKNWISIRHLELLGIMKTGIVLLLYYAVVLFVIIVYTLCGGPGAVASDRQGSIFFFGGGGGQCHPIHLTILRRSFWPSSAYMCTKVA